MPDGRKGTVIDYRGGTVDGYGFKPNQDSPTTIMPDGCNGKHEEVVLPNWCLRSGWDR